MGNIKQKIKTKAADAVKKAATGAESALETVSADRKKSAEASVKEKFSDIPDQAKINLVEYTFENPEEIKAQLDQLRESNETQIDLVLSKIENIAFKYHFYDVTKNYAAQFPVVEIKKEQEGKEKYCRVKVDSSEKCVRGILIKKIVLDKDELQSDKLNNVYSSVAETGSTLVMLIHRTHSDCYLTFLIKAKDGDDQSVVADNTIRTLEDVLLGNFPGSKTLYFDGGAGMPEIYRNIPEISGELDIIEPERRLDGYGAYFRDNEKIKYSVPDLYDEVFTEHNTRAISAFTGVPSLKSKDSKYVNQGIEKLIDGIVPEEGEAYTLLLIADPLSPHEVSQIRGGYEDLASIISPYQGFQYNQTYVEAQTVNNQTTESINNQITLSTNYAMGMGAHADASANAHIDGNSGISKPAGGNDGNTISSVVKDGGLKTRTKQAIKNTFYGGDKITASSRPATMESSGAAMGGNAGASIGLNIHADIAENIASGRSYSATSAYGFTENKGRNEGTTYEYISSRVKNIYEKLEKEIQRINEGESSGLWHFSGFSIASNRALSQRVAHIYQGLIQGEKSSIERPSVNTWNQGDENYNAILTSILNLEIPSFIKNYEESRLPKKMIYGTEVNSAELSLLMNLPQKAVPGIPVISCAAFGRNVCTIDGKQQRKEDGIKLGYLYHMSQSDKSSPVLLNKEKLTSHLFVTGSTGTGKSNTIYKIVQEISEPEINTDSKAINSRSDIHFMIIEPTKGEYKNIFGGWENVEVYGTNPKLSKLLKINPFEFPVRKIHVLEHIDRLVEIFNACWPMYAAMPAILKEAIEESYRSVGWDLDYSENEFMRFPTFWDLLQILPKVVRKSHYSEDTNSDYIGALVTRVNSLTTGLNGKIFNSIERISDEELFGENTIIDLSMSGAHETKALIMGMLILKLQEYRIDLRLNHPDCADNEKLKHITVLEEAHLLLRKTSFEQSQEGANLQGKSVEMLTNAIAEMRTYGESFIIADQAPELLDPAVIRNTNTKIVMRLPDKGDRELLGGALALNEDQMMELAKLPNWVGGVYQSDWLEPVLCLIDSFKEKNKRQYRNFEGKKSRSLFAQFLSQLVKCNESRELTIHNQAEMLKTIESSILLSEFDQIVLGKLFSGKNISDQERKTLEYDLMKGDRFVSSLYSILEDSDENAVFQYREIVNQMNRQYGLNDLEVSRKILEDCFEVAKKNLKLNEEEKKLLENRESKLMRIKEVDSWR